MPPAGVIVLAGLPGAGKSTLARALASRLADARVLDKDVVRDALFGPCDHTATESQVSVSAMLDAARYHLGRGRTAVGRAGEDEGRERRAEDPISAAERRS